MLWVAISSELKPSVLEGDSWDTRKNKVFTCLGKLKLPFSQAPPQAKTKLKGGDSELPGYLEKVFQSEEQPTNCRQLQNYSFCESSPVLSWASSTLKYSILYSHPTCLLVPQLGLWCHHYLGLLLSSLPEMKKKICVALPRKVFIQHIGSFFFGCWGFEHKS